MLGYAFWGEAVSIGDEPESQAGQPPTAVASDTHTRTRGAASADRLRLSTPKYTEQEQSFSPADGRHVISASRTKLIRAQTAQSALSRLA